MPKSSIVITGMGITSAIGMNVTENLYSLQNGLHGISYLENIKSFHSEKLPVAEIKYTNKVLAEIARYKSELTPRSVLLSLLSIREALEMADMDSSLVDGFIYGTTVGGIDLSEVEMQNYFKGDPVNYSVFKTHDDGKSAELISSHFNFSVPGQTISTACSSAANAIMLAAGYLISGRKKRVIAGGADGLSKFTINGFNSLMILDKQLCRPFDMERGGLNLGEGSAFLVMETEETAINRGAKILARLSGWANRNDAFHQTASSEDGRGARMAMSAAINKAALIPEDIDHINAHGTGTQNNDNAESTAMLEIFRTLPSFTSTKSYTGHTLAAAGSLEAVFSIMSLQNQEVYPTLRSLNPISSNLIPVGKYHNTALQHVLSNSFGFGGNCTSLIFSKA